MNNNPLVSVILSVYNGEKTIVKTIESILSQTFADFELIVIDNGSTDRTYEILQKFSDTDKRIKLFRNHITCTRSKALNFGILKAAGKYIARIDADDQALPERLARQVDYLEKHPECGVLGSFVKEINESGEIMPRKQNPILWEDIQKDIFKYNPVFHPSVMMRKEVVDASGGYNEDYLDAEDYELFSRLIETTRFANIPEMLVVRFFPEKVSPVKMRTQNIEQLKIQWGMLRRRAVPWWGVFYMTKYIFTLCLPVGLREFVRRIRHRKHR